MPHKYPNLRHFVKNNVLDSTLAAFDPLVDKITRRLFRDMQQIYAESLDKSEKGNDWRIQNLLTMLVFLPPGFPSTDMVAQLCEDWADDEIQECKEAYKEDVELIAESKKNEENEDEDENQ